MKRKRVISTIHHVFDARKICMYGSKNRPIYWKVTGYKKTAYGCQVSLQIPIGRSFKDVDDNLDYLQIALDVDSIRVHYNKGRILTLEVIGEPLPTKIPFSGSVLDATRGTWRVLIGYKAGMIPIFHDFANPNGAHLLIGAMAGFGKSKSLQNILTQLVLNHPPEELSLMLIDLKKTSFQFLSGMPHVMPIAGDKREALSLLQKALYEMNRRYDDLEKFGYEDWSEYEIGTGSKWQHIFVVVDEGGQLAPEHEKDSDEVFCQELMTSLAEKGRAAAVHLIFCTQRPDRSVVSMRLRANMSAAIAFHVRGPDNSKIILQHEGAELLPLIPGRGIYQGVTEDVIQVPEVRKILIRWLMLKRNMFQRDTFLEPGRTIERSKRAW